jgi:hypothetical protein
MKKVILSTAVSLLVSVSYSQIYWPINPISISNEDHGRLGTNNNRSLNLVTNDTLRVQIDSLGRVRFMNYNTSGSLGNRLVYLSPNGFLVEGGVGMTNDGCHDLVEQNGQKSVPCYQSAIPWFEGGNSIGACHPKSILGTCNDYDLIFKTNDVNRVWLKWNTGYMGIGESTPAARLHVFEPAALGGTTNNSQLLTRVTGSVNSNSFMNNLWLRRFDGNQSSWQGAALHDGISIDASYLTPGTNTKTWWERRPDADVQLWGTGSNPYLTIAAGNVGIGTGFSTGNAKLSVNSQASDGIECTTSSNSAKAFRVYNSTSSKETFVVYGDGKVVFGDKKIQSGHTHANSTYQFHGKMACKELVVLDATKWADYVFDNDYPLLSLKKLEAYYTKHHHLPDVPSAKEVSESGIDIAKMNEILLRKIEELTIYIVALEKRLETIESRRTK